MMKLSKLSLVALLTGISALCVPAPALPAIILFSDNFDGETVGTLPTTPSGPGFYAVLDSGDFPDAIPPNVRVYDGVFAAASSPNYLQVTRTSGTWNQVDAMFAPQSTPGDVIRFEWDMRGPDGGSSYVGIGTNLYDVDTAVTGLYVIQGGSVVSIGGGTGIVPPADAWNHFVVDVTLGGSNFTLSVNGSAPLTLSMLTVVSSLNDLMLAQATVGSAAAYDNVVITNLTATPEPSSLVLLGFAFVGLVANARRKQRGAAA